MHFSAIHLLFWSLLWLSGCKPDPDLEPPVILWEVPSGFDAVFESSENIPVRLRITDDGVECHLCDWHIELRQADGITLVARLQGTGAEAEAVFSSGLLEGRAWLAAIAEDEAGNRAAAFKEIDIVPEPASALSWWVVQENGEIIGESNAGLVPWTPNVLTGWPGNGGLVVGRDDGVALGLFPGMGNWWSEPSGGSAWTSAVVHLMPVNDITVGVLHADGYAELGIQGSVGFSFPASSSMHLPKTFAIDDSEQWLMVLEDRPGDNTSRLRGWNRETGVETTAIDLPFPIDDLQAEGSGSSFLFLSPQNGWNRVDAGTGNLTEISGFWSENLAHMSFLPSSAGELFSAMLENELLVIAHRESGILDVWEGGSLTNWSVNPQTQSWWAIERTGPWHPVQAALGASPPASTGQLIQWTATSGWSTAVSGLGVGCRDLAIASLE